MRFIGSGRVGVAVGAVTRAEDFGNILSTQNGAAQPYNAVYGCFAAQKMKPQTITPLRHKARQPPHLRR